MRIARALSKIVAIAGWTLILLPAQLVGLMVYRPLAVRVPLLYHRGICRVLGLHVEIWGRRTTSSPALFVSNHSSWLDITVLAKVIPGSFISKREVANWPFFGLLARLQRSIFIERDRRLVADHRDVISVRLENGDNLILFPEGTSGDGNRVLTFKSALFAVAEQPVRGRPLTIQPVTVAYTRLDFMPLGRHLRPYFAWYGNMPMGSHLWRVLGLGPATVVVTFHDTITIEDFASRKALAEHCHAVVAHGLSQALSGRPRGEEPEARRPTPDFFADGQPSGAPTRQNS